jgi:hypothetical protein
VNVCVARQSSDLAETPIDVAHDRLINGLEQPRDSCATAPVPRCGHLSINRTKRLLRFLHSVSQLSSDAFLKRLSQNPMRPLDRQKIFRGFER